MIKAMNINTTHFYNKCWRDGARPRNSSGYMDRRASGAGLIKPRYNKLWPTSERHATCIGSLFSTHLDGVCVP